MAFQRGDGTRRVPMIRLPSGFEQRIENRRQLEIVAGRGDAILDF